MQGPHFPQTVPNWEGIDKAESSAPGNRKALRGCQKSDPFLARRHRYGSFLGTYVNMASDTHTQGTHKGIIIVDNLFRNTISKRLFLVLEKLLNPNLKP